MCGIWGYVGWDDTVTVDAAWDGLCSLTDRGPDDWGLYVDGVGKVTDEPALPSGSHSVLLGNRRLSILDVSAAGNQPMCTDDGHWIVYNGEVYNYRELREELRDDGYTFESDTDTEVVLKAYQEYGTDCVEHFRGMFAFVVYDSDADRMFAARDRFGIKPFYYTARQGGVAFASEVTSLLDSGIAERTLDPVGVDGFLTFGYVPAPATIIEGVRSLPPGSTLTSECDGSDPHIESYYELEFDESDAEYSHRLRTLLTESVQLRLRSDVPVGAFLSGGLDSSSIVALMCEIAPSDADIRTYSIGFEEDAYSETTFAEEMADYLETEHTSLSVTADDVAAELPDIVAAMDQPSVDGVNTYFVSKLAAEDGIKVALSGLGSDELLYGYPTFEGVDARYRQFRWLEALPDKLRGPLGRTVERVGRFLPEQPTDKIADILRSKSPFGAAYILSRGLFTTAQRRRLTSGQRTTDWSERIGKDVEWDRNTTKAVAAAELTWYMQNQLLRDTDAMSMAQSLEVRVPFLDTQLAEFALSIPDESKTGSEKRVLKEAVEDVVPSSITDREKTGFIFPMDIWLNEELRPVLDAVFEDDCLLQRAKLEPAAARDVRQSFENGELYWQEPWAIVVLSKWVERHL
ncbi:asparagine synthase (glutamine-hydrolyzing) [Haloarcula pellucida]|uniref:Putative asparagine synthetase [glutamine-hydrolyzing] n=1 Tax=Haloarcula pellucida TaxID=1427151 RepID=A0A830GJF5_9EURY|nr:asparagine synthase (glutamine-hydrolyzing) [Halomicroarcula pellucida]MBX0348704.1 asparagine synthase (glutamine-hydrolyzing) [Halomicroarcula pellucida]GGN92141.1 asparagine synthetase B [Halomicroarcula pellucida]